MICDHCQLPINGKVHRVTSLDNGAVILSMIVCDAYSREARKLGLKTEEIDSPKRHLVEHD
jgi:hypothetical protein